MLAGTSEAGPRSWVIAALDLLFPALCPVCRTALDIGRRDPLCGQCWAGLERLHAPWCTACGMPLPGRPEDEAMPPAATIQCPGCVLDPLPFVWARAGGRYAGVLREAIHAFKFGGKQALARPLGDLVVEQVATDIPDGVDALVPVPLAAARERERGFNQAALLAERLGGRLAIPVRARWLRRIRPTQAQADLSAAERRANVCGAFQASRRATGRHVIVVDDVLTTGATVAECAHALRASGARRVGVLTIARVI